MKLKIKENRTSRVPRMTEPKWLNGFVKSPEEIQKVNDNIIGFSSCPSELNIHRKDQVYLDLDFNYTGINADKVSQVITEESNYLHAIAIKKMLGNY